jgi:hypothetical protein
MIYEDIATEAEMAEMAKTMGLDTTPRPATQFKSSYGDLTELPTRILLVMQADLRNSGHSTVTWYRPESLHSNRVYEANSDQVRAELAKRPHVMNKAESKLMRKLQAQTRMSEEQIRNIPKYKTMLADASGNLIKVGAQKFELYKRHAPELINHGNPRISVKK